MTPNKRVQEPKTFKKFLKPTLAQNNCFHSERFWIFVTAAFAPKKSVEGILRPAENNLETIPIEISQ